MTPIHSKIMMISKCKFCHRNGNLSLGYGGWFVNCAASDPVEAMEHRTWCDGWKDTPKWTTPNRAILEWNKANST